MCKHYTFPSPRPSPSGEGAHHTCVDTYAPREALNKLIPSWFDKITTNEINNLPFVLSLSKD
jgi:hypothetical protein